MHVFKTTSEYHTQDKVIDKYLAIFGKHYATKVLQSPQFHYQPESCFIALKTDTMLFQDACDSCVDRGPHPWAHCDNHGRQSAVRWPKAHGQVSSVLFMGWMMDALEWCLGLIQETWHKEPPAIELGANYNMTTSRGSNSNKVEIDNSYKFILTSMILF
jgi:hypothetical protein